MKALRYDILRTCFSTPSSCGVKNQDSLVKSQLVCFNLRGWKMKKFFP